VCGKTEKLAAELPCYFLGHLNRKNMSEGWAAPLAKTQSQANLPENTCSNFNPRTQHPKYSLL
jgi:hypothetical protein